MIADAMGWKLDRITDEIQPKMAETAVSSRFLTVEAGRVCGLIQDGVGYRSVVQKLAYAPMTCAPGECYAYQNVAFSLVGDVVFAATGRFYSEAVTGRIFKPLGMDDASYGLDGIRALIEWAGWDTRFVDALPTALVKPFSGSAARAMLIETMQTHGVDSFPALVAATIQGSTETTFYVLAVYFGAVGIQRARHAVGCALVADVAGVLAAIAICYWFFG